MHGHMDVKFMEKSSFWETLLVSIQDDSEGEVSILGGNIIDYCEKKARMTICRILNGYPDRAV
jgi:hypothetical protein